MTVRLAVAASVVALSLTACATQEDAAESDGTWVGTITTEGDVTTVVNESGSVWGGTARLVEEASIGVESGADEYMLGQVAAIAADGQRIIVADEQAATVRTYDYAGRFLREIGSRGQGPGEFTSMRAVAGGSAGEVYILDARRVVVYDAEGAHVRTFSVPGAAWGWPIYPVADDMVLIASWERDGETGERKYGVQPHAGAGIQHELFYVPEVEFEPIMHKSGGREREVPLGPRVWWAPTPTGGVVVGASDRYRFEVHHPDGSVLVVENSWEPILYPREEIEWWRGLGVLSMQSRNWDGAEIPDSKPAFAQFIPDISGGYWVVRPGPSVKLPDCTEDPTTLDPEIVGRMGSAAFRQCWATEWLLDAFDAEGRFLGPVEAPRLPSELAGFGTYPRPLSLFIDGDTVVASEEGADGVVRVKRYRLVLPGER